MSSTTPIPTTRRRAPHELVLINKAQAIYDDHKSKIDGYEVVERSEVLASTKGNEEVCASIRKRCHH